MTLKIRSTESCHMNLQLPCLLLWLSAPAIAEPPALLDPKTRPAIIKTSELAEFGSLPEDRQKLIEVAIAIATDSPWLPYLPGGVSPADGGFDCSGATYFIMSRAGLDPPRSSGWQMDWLKKNDRLHPVPTDARDRNHESFSNLLPGDLLFWAREDQDRNLQVHHVAMFLGTEKRDGRAVMIGSTDGRSYRGQVANGYGVHDFRIPAKDSPSMLIGYGTPPGIALHAPRNKRSAP
jgi:peptidoglycan DL-endopeptidase CwlO